MLHTQPLATRTHSDNTQECLSRDHVHIDGFAVFECTNVCLLCCDVEKKGDRNNMLLQNRRPTYAVQNFSIVNDPTTTPRASRPGKKKRFLARFAETARTEQRVIVFEASVIDWNARVVELYTGTGLKTALKTVRNEDGTRACTSYFFVCTSFRLS